MIASLANSAGWNWIGPILIAEKGAVDLLADARAAAAAPSSAMPTAAIV